MALIFSFLAFLMSAAALFMHFENSPFVRNAQRRLTAFQNSLPAPKKSSSANPAAEGAAPRPSAGDSAWDQLREKLYRAEAMIRNQDGQVKDYLASLRTELDRLGSQSGAQGGQWIADASEKLKAIRQQVTVNGPEAARRLRDLTAEIQQQARTLQRVNDALRAVTPARGSRAATPANPADPRNSQVPAVPLREDQQQ